MSKRKKKIEAVPKKPWQPPAEPPEVPAELPAQSVNVTATPDLIEQCKAYGEEWRRCMEAGHA